MKAPEELGCRTGLLHCPGSAHLRLLHGGSGAAIAAGEFGFGCSFAFIMLLALKLAGVIGWSWWLVTLPLWGQVVIPFLWLFLLLGGGARPRG